MGVHVQVLEIFAAGAAALERAGGSRVSLQGCSLGKGSSWRREERPSGAGVG